MAISFFHIDRLIGLALIGAASAYAQAVNATLVGTVAEASGQMCQVNRFQIEGLHNNQSSRNLQVLIPPAEAIQTVDIPMSNHDSELGYRPRRAAVR